jgi:16S rRNA pseudouridine516 synthase
MSGLIRLDKYLADMGVGTRSEVKNYIRKGRVQINDVTTKESDKKINIDSDKVTFDGSILTYVSTEYYMLNKPSGVVSATRDNLSKTVLDLIDSTNKDLFPVGRLDKDTEGFLLITNDGDLAHKLLSPKKKVSKVYYAKVDGRITKEDVETFSKGIQLSEDFTTLPAGLEIIESGEISTVKVIIHEGKFHQVKRMFEAVEKEVIYLKRLSMGDLILDENLALGEYRPLTEEEIKMLKGEN